jgi:hypothetical protein
LLKEGGAEAVEQFIVIVGEGAVGGVVVHAVDGEGPAFLPGVDFPIGQQAGGDVVGGVLEVVGGEAGVAHREAGSR